MNRKRFGLLYLVLLIAAFTLSACQAVANVETGGVKAPPPAADKTTVAGRVINSGGGSSNLPVRLAAIYRQGDQGAFVLDLAHSPGAFTDKDGYFVIPNIEAREYTIVVGDPEATYTIMSDSKGQALTWKPEVGKVLNVGDLKVNIKP